MNYSYCLLKDTCRVYVITRRNISNTDEIMRRRIYTEPYRSKNNEILTNMIIGYCNKSMCEEKVKKLYYDDTTINKTNILYLKGVCARLSLPIPLIITLYHIMIFDNSRLG